MTGEVALTETQRDAPGVPIRGTGARGLVSWRKEAGFSRRELSEALGVSPSTVANWERARRGLPTRWIPDLAVVFELPDAAVVHRLQICPPDVRQPVLVQLRIRAGLTQSQVASELDVSFGLVGHWERGSRQRESRSVPCGAERR
jgi:transcriptional regulator with XRE-family HTH domain